MSQVKVKENESLESALRRFKRQTSRDGVLNKWDYLIFSAVRRNQKQLVKESISKKKAGSLSAFSFCETWREL